MNDSKPRMALSFFFSSRRRHTRCLSDWSSDVCSSDLVDPGALVGTAGGVSETLAAGAGSAAGSLFTIAQTDTLSVYVTVPEDYAAAVAIGKPAVITVPARPGDTLRGGEVRTAGSLDVTARPLLTQLRVAKPPGGFLAGKHADGQPAVGAGGPTVSVPAPALVVRDGPPHVLA